ncbi:unnamed protein product [Closterium sp. NIES-53]
MSARRVKDKANKDARNSAGGDLLRGSIADKDTRAPNPEHRCIAILPHPTQCRRGLWQGDTGPEVELMRSVLDRKRPQKIGSSRMDHRVLQEVGGELTTSVTVQTQDKKVLTKPLTELETDCTDPRDQDNRDLTLAAQGEDRGVTRAVANNQQSGAARGAESGGGEPAGAEPRGAEPASAEPGGAEPEGAEPGGAETEGADPGGAESEGAESGGAELRGTASARGPAGASPR